MILVTSSYDPRTPSSMITPLRGNLYYVTHPGDVIHHGILTGRLPFHVITLAPGEQCENNNAYCIVLYCVVLCCVVLCCVVLCCVVLCCVVLCCVVLCCVVLCCVVLCCVVLCCVVLCCVVLCCVVLY